MLQSCMCHDLVYLMQIHCPSCQASYTIDATKLGSGGRTVRCKKCATTWFAAAQESAPAPMDFMAEPVVSDPEPSSVSQAPAPRVEPAAVPSRPVIASEGDLSRDEMDMWSEAFAEEERGKPEPAADPAPDPQAAIDAALAEAAEQDKVVEAASMPARKSRKHSPKSAKIRLRLRSDTMLACASLAASLLLVWAVSARDSLSRAVPALAPVYQALGFALAADGLALSDVKSEWIKQDADEILVVSGMIANLGRQEAEIPILRLAVQDKAGLELYVWTVNGGKGKLPTGETTSFRARLAAPPPSGHSVSARFVPIGDGQAKPAAKAKGA
jgi:predicted Zn finger-like uncharacterized protein